MFNWMTDRYEKEESPLKGLPDEEVERLQYEMNMARFKFVGGLARHIDDLYAPNPQEDKEQ